MKNRVAVLVLKYGVKGGGVSVLVRIALVCARALLSVGFGDMCVRKRAISRQVATTSESSHTWRSAL
jgi:hypothetical protein